jgi:hypothetical protein
MKFGGPGKCACIDNEELHLEHKTKQIKRQRERKSKAHSLKAASTPESQYVNILAIETVSRNTHPINTPRSRVGNERGKAVTPHGWVCAQQRLLLSI